MADTYKDHMSTHIEQQGTKDNFIVFLRGKSLNYTKYSKLPTDVKMKIRKEYKG